MMRNYAHVVSKVFGTPLLLDPRKAAQIVGALQQRFADGAALDRPAMSPSLPAVARRIGYDMNKYYPVTPHGVAVLTIEGTLVHKAMGAHPPSGFMTYPDIEEDLRDAAEDPRIKAIYLDIDSPGGEATDSVFQLANAVRAAAAIKPVWAIVDEQATSAAYLIASGATRIVAPEAATTGSIGVIALHLDASAHEAEAGFKWTVVRAGARKAEGLPYEAAPPEFFADLQASVNRLYDRFVAAVAANRGMTEAAVRATEALSYDDSREALRLGLIDQIATPEEALAELTASLQARNAVPGSGAAAPYAAQHAAPQPAAAAAPQKETTMTDPKAAPQAPQQAAKRAEDGTTCETCGKQLAGAADAAALANARKIGADAERARILAIQAHGKAMPGHDSVIAACVDDPTVTADAAAARLIAAEGAARGKQLAARAGDDNALAAALQPAPTATGAATAPAVDPEAPIEDRCKAAWDRDSKLRAEFGGKFGAYVAYEKAVASGSVRILKLG